MFQCLNASCHMFLYQNKQGASLFICSNICAEKAKKKVKKLRLWSWILDGETCGTVEPTEGPGAH